MKWTSSNMLWSNGIDSKLSSSWDIFPTELKILLSLSGALSCIQLTVQHLNNSTIQQYSIRLKLPKIIPQRYHKILLKHLGLAFFNKVGCHGLGNAGILI